MTRFAVSTCRFAPLLAANIIFLAVGVGIAVAGSGCGEDDATPAPMGDAGSGGSATEAGPPVLGEGDGGGDGSNDAGGDAGAGDGGRGINVDVNGTSYSLANAARAAIGGNGYSVQANRIDGTQMVGLTILLVKAESNNGTPKYVVPTPGTYACSASVPAAPYLWARIQYTGPDGTYQYGSGATCVSLTEFGAVGEPVVGTFQTTLDRVTGSGPATVTVSGDFDVDRAN